jgi:hypothetical protein
MNSHGGGEAKTPNMFRFQTGRSSAGGRYIFVFAGTIQREEYNATGPIIQDSCTIPMKMKKRIYACSRPGIFHEAISNLSRLQEHLESGLLDSAYRLYGPILWEMRSCLPTSPYSYDAILPGVPSIKNASQPYAKENSIFAGRFICREGIAFLRWCWSYSSRDEHVCTETM